LLADELVALVLGVVVVLELAGRVHLEVQELVPVGPAVANAKLARLVLITQEEVVALLGLHCKLL
jgi:hypothetical protein